MTDQVFIVGCDPGTSAGIRILDPDGYSHLAWQGAWENAGTIVRDFLRDLSHAATAVLVTERFTVGSRGKVMTRQTIPQELNAILRGLTRNFDVTYLEQGPSDVKKLANDALLRDLDLYLTGKMIGQGDANDVNDATRHAVYYLATKRATVFTQRLGVRVK